MKVKETTLTVLILKFLKDSNKYVRIAGFKELGPFIHCLLELGSQISEKLLDNFCQMAGEDDEEVPFILDFYLKKSHFL